jgi:hypothetical protein
VPGQPSNFVNSFTLTGSNQFLVPQGTPSGGSFVLPPTSGDTNVITLETTNFAPALSTIMENVPTGWTLTSIAFHSQFGTSTGSSSATTETIGAAGDDTVWITFSDQLTATSLVTNATPTGTITLPGDGTTETLRGYLESLGLHKIHESEGVTTKPSAGRPQSCGSPIDRT